MNPYVTGAIIRKLQKKKGPAKAEQLFVSDKAVS